MNIKRKISKVVKGCLQFGLNSEFLFLNKQTVFKVVSTCLIEFAGGIQCNSTSTKEKSDTTKLYKNMKKIIINLPDNIPKRIYCVRFFELFMLENKFYRNEHAKIVCPTTLELMKKYVEAVPKLFSWKHAVLNQTLEFNKK
ncbi:hypothetical protein EDC94DRAFT_591216 [Helicostylum pulchrum]|nr:hypothetical protein EDC94DRAFT_591216 [Helicostylum pulchrum]